MSTCKDGSSGAAPGSAAASAAEAAAAAVVEVAAAGAGVPAAGDEAVVLFHSVSRFVNGSVDMKATLLLNPAIVEPYTRVCEAKRWAVESGKDQQQVVRIQGMCMGLCDELLRRGVTPKATAFMEELDRALEMLRAAPDEPVWSIWVTYYILRVQYCSDACFETAVKAGATTAPGVHARLMGNAPVMNAHRDGVRIQIEVPYGGGDRAKYNEEARLQRCMQCGCMFVMEDVAAFRAARERDESGSKA
jgi:hypothetical protein